MSDIHNSLRQATEVSLAIRRMFGGDSGLSVERLSETLQPTVDIWAHPYCAHLRGDRPWAFGILQGAVAAETSGVGCYVQSGADVLNVVEKISVLGATTAQLVTLRVATEALLASLGNAVTEVARDRRGRVPRLVAATGSDADTQLGGTAPLVEYLFDSLTEVRDFRNLPIILTPGTGLYVMKTVVNEAIYVNMSGFEKPLVPGERV